MSRFRLPSFLAPSAVVSFCLPASPRGLTYLLRELLSEEHAKESKGTEQMKAADLVGWEATEKENGGKRILRGTGKHGKHCEIKKVKGRINTVLGRV